MKYLQNNRDNFSHWNIFRFYTETREKISDKLYNKLYMELHRLYEPLYGKFFK